MGNQLDANGTGYNNETAHPLFEPRLRELVDQHRPARFLHHLIVWVANAAHGSDGRFEEQYLEKVFPHMSPAESAAIAQHMMKLLLNSTTPGVADIAAQFQFVAGYEAQDTWARVVAEFIFEAERKLRDNGFNSADDSGDEKEPEEVSPEVLYPQLVALERALAASIPARILSVTLASLPSSCVHGHIPLATPYDAAARLVALMQNRNVVPDRKLLNNWEWAAKHATQNLPYGMPPKMVKVLGDIKDPYLKCVSCWQKSFLTPVGATAVTRAIDEALSYQMSARGGGLSYAAVMSGACAEVARLHALYE